jgi:hypothetical protein
MPNESNASYATFFGWVDFATSHSEARAASELIVGTVSGVDSFVTSVLVSDPVEPQENKTPQQRTAMNSFLISIYYSYS